MPPSMRKKEFKGKLTEVNAKCRQLEIRQQHIRSLIILEDEEVIAEDGNMEFDEAMAAHASNDFDEEEEERAELMK
jgi:hypothetical protein